MTTPNLAKIERVDLREAWPNEARDFTPWLAENIAELGEALGMDLELQETEAAVGGYSLDILARDRKTNDVVIIENQLEPSDHDHLGKLLTYAVGSDANVIVWVAREFRDEHRQALHWLNWGTTDDRQFYGVVVELWRIDNSAPAPHFDLVERPRDWPKEKTPLVPEESAAVSNHDQPYKAFFQDLIDALQTNNFEAAIGRTGRPLSLAFFSSGIRGFKYMTHFDKGHTAQISLMIDFSDRETNVALLENLEQSRDQIEYEFGQALYWDRIEGGKFCRIAIARPGSISDNEDILEVIKLWMVDNLLKFRDVFGPRLAELVR